MRERHLKEQVIARAELKPGQEMLDIGCGTGTLALMARKAHPTVSVVGVDGDPMILRVARRKVEHTGTAVRFDEAMAYSLPYKASTFDAVVSTLAFHHLTFDQQERTLAEARRVLRPGGRLVVADFAAPHNRVMVLLTGFLPRILRRHGNQRAPHLAPAEPFDVRLASKGWSDITPPEHFMTLMGTLDLHRAVRPTDAV
jgi:ubiquinone/menaquinone biosynthesis C-methylase UbiE